MTTKPATIPGAGAAAPATPPLPRETASPAGRVEDEALLDVPEARGLVAAAADAPTERDAVQDGLPPRDRDARGGAAQAADAAERARETGAETVEESEAASSGMAATDPSPGSASREGTGERGEDAAAEGGAAPGAETSSETWVPGEALRRGTPPRLAPPGASSGERGEDAAAEGGAAPGAETSSETWVPGEALRRGAGPPPSHESRASTPPPRRRRTVVFAGLAAVAVVAALVLPRLAVVPDDDMAPSLLAGDLVLVGSGTPAIGEVVAVVDPLDPSRWTLRRVETIGGAIRYEAGVYLTGNTPRTLEMGRDDTFVTRTVDDHLVRARAREVRWEMDPVTVPDDAAFLGADSRDDAMDSRWWGPLPLAALQGRVLLRLGAPGHPWRGWLTTTP